MGVDDSREAGKEEDRLLRLYSMEGTPRSLPIQYHSILIFTGHLPGPLQNFLKIITTSSQYK